MFWLYTEDLDRIGLIEGYSSMIWQRRYQEPGAFQLTMPFIPICKDLIAERLVVNGNEAGIIENIGIDQDKKTGENVFVCSGRFLSGYLERRILLGVNSYTGTPEDAMRYLVTKNAATAGDREIEHLSVAKTGGTPGSIAYVGQNTNLLAELQLIAEANGLGFAVDFSPAGFTFRVYTGLDRTAGQSVNPRAIFSKAFENVLKQSYDGSVKAVKNVAYVDAIYTVTRTVTDRKTGTDVEITTEYPLSRTVGTATGRARREVYVDAGDVTKDDAGTTLSAAQRSAAMDDAGNAELIQATEAFTAEVDPYGNLKYKTDYDLGDVVTVDSRELGMRVNARITEIKEIYEGKGLGLELTLGYGIPSFAKTVRWLANV